jgi:oligopeptide/dipeptide ABC transporter ATP-binding protein
MTNIDGSRSVGVPKLPRGDGEIADRDLILEVKNLKKYFPVRSEMLKRRIGWIKAVDGVSFTIKRGEIFGIVGESGCGKSTLGKTILGIYRPNEGSVVFKGDVITGLPKKKAQKVRQGLQYVYQDAGASLDPMWIIGNTLREPLLIHTRLPKAEIEEKIKAVLSAVGLRGEHLSRYPHEFSGGQQRRLGLARILTLNPGLIIFDEPTSGLDVSVQATILKLLKKLAKDYDLTYILISHNLAVIRMMCHRVGIMYLGRLMEMGYTEEIFESPRHPYTKFLLAAIPEPGKRKEEVILKGEPPSPENLPPGCRFWPRCPYKETICAEREPQLRNVGNNHAIACHFGAQKDFSSS